MIVLGGDHNSDSSLPITSQMGNETLKRLIEGIRIYRRNLGSKLVLSCSDCFDKRSDAEAMADIAKLLEVDGKDIITESESRDTKVEARILTSILTTDDFVLVTSATHMPRSIDSFGKQGLRPIAAPAEHLVHERPLSE